MTKRMHEGACERWKDWLQIEARENVDWSQLHTHLVISLKASLLNTCPLFSSCVQVGGKYESFRHQIRMKLSMMDQNFSNPSQSTEMSDLRNKPSKAGFQTYSTTSNISNKSTELCLLVL